MASHKAHKKEHFLKAFAKYGTISRAAKAIRISRDAVHDWRQHDPAFASAFLLVKHLIKTAPKPTLTIDDAIHFFSDAIKPLIPRDLWPIVVSELLLAGANQKFKERAKSGARSPRAKEDVSVPCSPTEIPATSVDGIDASPFLF